jgi:hypothetical protein
MTIRVTSRRKWKRSEVFIIALSVVGLVFGLFYQAPLIPGLSSQNTCVGIGGWPCGYTGPFTGDYYSGYATLGCTPINPISTCVVPQIAMLSSFLVIKNASYVIDWANQSLRWNNQLADGSTISVSGKLAPIFYNKTSGSTFLIYHSNVRGLWSPQPELQIQNATLTTQPIVSTCTTTLTFTVSGPPNGVWNPPMIPAGACYTIANTAQQPHTVGSMDIPIPVAVLASSAGVGVIIVGTLMLLRKRRKHKMQ